MSLGPEWFKMASVDDFVIKGEVVLIVGLREYVFIVLAGNVNGCLVGMC